MAVGAQTRGHKRAPHILLPSFDPRVVHSLVKVLGIGEAFALELVLAVLQFLRLLTSPGAKGKKSLDVGIPTT